METRDKGHKHYFIFTLHIQKLWKQEIGSVSQLMNNHFKPVSKMKNLGFSETAYLNHCYISQKLL